MTLRSVIAIAVGAVFVIAGGGAYAGEATRTAASTAAPSLHNLTVAVPAAAPLSEARVTGNVVFTFDDGPDAYTQALLTELQRLHVPAVFFVFGWKAEAYPALIREELADGDLIENHTWDHLSFTGASTDTPPLAPAKIRAELSVTQQALTSLGVPAPQYYRPPFGDVTPQDNAIAVSLGLKIIQPFAVTSNGNVTDSRDWTGISAAQIVKDVTHGYTITQNGKTAYRAGISAGSVIGFHDSSVGDCVTTDPTCADVKQTILSLPGIVAWMNAHHLGATVRLAGAMTGGMNLAVPAS
ncbi:MAG TPA: polysaccharide deacetylase family protein [Trebonia sp.]|jgi:peptidoglycan/xylan/chitin deacetylase (PgdA/CDA1 family)